VNEVALKKVGDELSEAIVAFGIKHRTRSELRTVVVERLRRSGLKDSEKRVVVDHVLVTNGYIGRF
jgi:hypothetical protein